MKAYVSVVTAFFLALTACGKEEAPAAEEPAAGESAAPDASAHNGPNGGHVLMLGNQEAFLEVKTNPMVGTVTMWVYKGKKMEETIPLDEEPVFNFVAKTGPMQMVGEEYDDSWIFWDDEVLKEAFKKARFRIKLNGKTFAPPFVHSHKMKAPVTPDEASEGE